MKMKLAAMTAIGLVTLAGLMLTAQMPELDPRIAEYDKGPGKIDVSDYPEEIQASYGLFEEKCGKCHKVARAINCEFVLEGEWERYVKRMMRRAGSFITSEEGKDIYDFVVYDSKVRKAELYEQKLKEQSANPVGP